MTKYFIILITIVFSPNINAQSPIGAWEASITADNGEKLRAIVIFADGYQALSIYNTTGKLVHSNGGTWKLEGNTMTERVEFNSDDPEAVGTQSIFKIALTDATLQIIDQDITFTKIDSGKPGALQGAWLMSGRVSDGKAQERDTTGPRKTMKILSGSRFQWIAYNTETKEFFGTGGGTYTTDNGKYVENIEFFSKDNSKAGLSLTFSYELIGGKWHHSGLSSKGEPIHEIWSQRK